MAIINQISNQTQPIQTVDTSTDFFNADKEPLSIEQLIEAFEDLVIRFDNDPNYYTKKDYYYLLKYLGEIIRQLKKGEVDEGIQEAIENIRTEISELQQKDQALDDNITTLQTALNDLQNQLASLLTNLDHKQNKEDSGLTTSSKTIVGAINELDAWKSTVDQDITSIENNVETVTVKVNSNSEEISSLWDAIDNLPQGDPTPIYTEGTSIDITEDNQISAVTDYDINVTIPVGGFEEPQTIAAGTDITTILKKLLEVVVGVKAVNPSITLESKNITEEYGTRIPTQQIGFTLNQGYFEPADSRWNGARQYMDCTITSVSVPGAAAYVDDIDGYVEIPEQILTKVQEYKITANAVSANTATPNDSNGNPIPGEKGFTGGSVNTSGTITFTPYYKAFMGGVDVESISELTSDNIRSVTAHQLSVTPTTKTLLNGQATSNNAKKAILIACPDVYKLISVQSELGTDMTDSFDLRGTVTVKCGEQSVLYNCYLCVVYGECKFQTVKLGKA